MGFEDDFGQASGRGSARGSIPQQRVVEKLDEYMGRRDYAGAERHLLYWLDEALMLGDKRGQLMVRNELVGHFRKTGDRERAFLHADAAMSLVDELDFGDTISAGTTYTNAATAHNAFGDDERALELFKRAMGLYESSPATDPRLLGGLYNNCALACVATGRLDEADDLFAKALQVMEHVENGQMEQAITYLNMADAAVARSRARATARLQEEAAFGAAARERRESTANAAVRPDEKTAAVAMASPDRGATAGEAAADDDLYVDAACEDEIERLLDTALALLDTPTLPHDGYYAFVCEKCAPTFAHYGYFLADADLRERARAVYERA